MATKIARVTQTKPAPKGTYTTKCYKVCNTSDWCYKTDGCGAAGSRGTKKQCSPPDISLCTNPNLIPPGYIFSSMIKDNRNPPPIGHSSTSADWICNYVIATDKPGELNQPCTSGGCEAGLLCDNSINICKANNGSVCKIDTDCFEGYCVNGKCQSTRPFHLWIWILIIFGVFIFILFLAKIFGDKNKSRKKLK